MLEAHSRGLLKSDYKQGLQSKIRENVILGTIAREWNFRAMRDRTMGEITIVAPHIDPSKVKSHLAEVLHLYKIMTIMMEHGILPEDCSRKGFLAAEAQHSVDIFEALMKNEEFKKYVL